MAEDNQLEQLRSVLALAYEKRESLALRLIHAVKNRMRAYTQRRPIIESLHIETKEDVAQRIHLPLRAAQTVEGAKSQSE